MKNIIVSFDKVEMRKRDWNAYTDSTPEAVMKVFDDVFIKGCFL